MNYELLDNGQVLKVEQIGESIIKTHHAMKYGIHLSVDKFVILANGQDVATITATIRDWLGQFTGEDREITFEVNGEQITEQAVDGVATLEVDSTFAGVIVVRSIVAGYDNGEVEVYAQ